MTVLLKKSAFISLELFLGFWFGILGSVFVSPFFDGFVRATSQRMIGGCASGPMEGDLFFMNLTLHLFMLLGVTIAGYFHFRTFEIMGEFKSAIGWSFMGMLLFVFLYGAWYSIAFSISNTYFELPVLSMVMPLCGAVLGFNFPILQK